MGSSKMRLWALTMAFAATGCGTNEQDEKAPAAQPNINITSTAPTSTTGWPTPPAPQAVPPAAPSEPTAVETQPQAPNTQPSTDAAAEAPNFEDNETANQNDYQPMDPYGSPYDMNAEVPYDQSYGASIPSQYQANSPYFVSDIQQQIGAVYQPFNQYVDPYQRPHLAQRYQQHRQLQNFWPGMRHVRPGTLPGWDQNRYMHACRAMERSRRWINYDLYNLIARTTRTLNNRGYRHPHGLERDLNDAVRLRDHRRAAELHDRLLDDSRQDRPHRPGR